MLTPTQVSRSVPPAWVGNEYASVNAFNYDNTRLLLIAVDHFQLFTGDGQYLADLHWAGASCEPRWSRTESNIFYYIEGNQIWKDDISRAFAEPIHTFTEYTSISGKGEGDISPDGHIALCGTRPDGGQDVFGFDLVSGTKGTVFPQTEPFDGLKIDGKNSIILSKSTGIYVLEPGGEFQLTPTNGHAAMSGSSLIWTSNADNAVYRVNIDDGTKVKLLDVPWPSAVDISACDTFAAVSTYSLNTEFPGHVVKVEFDGSWKVLCETKSVMIPKPDGGMYYNPQPKASLSRDGSRMVWCSNDGQTTDPLYCDVWLGIIDAPKPFPGYHEVNPGTGEYLWNFKIVDGKTVATLYVKD